MATLLIPSLVILKAHGLMAQVGLEPQSQDAEAWGHGSKGYPLNGVVEGHGLSPWDLPDLLERMNLFLC